MKFAQNLDEMQIPEWKRAYIDFRGLKKRITAVRKAEQGGSMHSPPSPHASPRQTASRLLASQNTRRKKYADSSVGQRPVPSLPNKSLRSLNEHSGTSASGDQNIETRPALSRMFANVTRRKSQRGSFQMHTTVGSLYASLDPLELSFFTHFDHEIEKVDTFYKEHESIAITKLSTLKDQLHELQKHRKLFKEARAIRDEPWNMLPRALGEALRFGHIPGPTGVSMKNHEDSIEEPRPHPFHERARDPSEYQRAKRKLKKACQEFYRNLELLNDYRVLNRTGFRKALKKFEKVTRHPVQELYMREKVESRRFALSGTMGDMMREVESIYAEIFEHGDRKKARHRLKSPSAPKSHHFSTFRSGLFLGVAIPALVHGIYSSFRPETRQKIPEWGALLEIYAVLFIPVIFSLLIGLNLLAWSRVHINFPFIFEFDVRSAIDAREYFELPTILFATLSYTFWLSFLNIGSHRVAPTTWPAIWIGFAFVVLVNPLPILSQSSRYWLLRNVLNLLTSGRSRVGFAHFWMGDQFCSLVFSMAHLFTIVCAYSNDWQNVFGKCSSSQHWPGPFVLSSFPSLVRLVQSIRRYYDSRLPTHLINGGKYLSSIVAYLTYYIWRVRGSRYDYTFVIWCLFATLSSGYTSSWDLLMDWSFLRPHSPHLFLRSELMYTNNPLIYYFSIVSNIIVRFIWVIYIPSAGVNRRIRAFIAAVLEMLRRFQWNFYRLENEQIGNTDQYRATREVPLPYSARNRDDDDDDDSDLEENDTSPPGEDTSESPGLVRMSEVVSRDGQSVEYDESGIIRRISRHQASGLFE